MLAKGRSTMLHEGRPAVPSVEGKAPNSSKTLLVIPKALQPTVMHELHSSVFGGHMGFGRTIGRITEHYWWRDMKSSEREGVHQNVPGMQ